MQAETVRTGEENRDQPKTAEKIVTYASERIKEVGTLAEEKAEQALSSVGEGLRSLSRIVRNKTSCEGITSQATETVAEKLDSAGKYLTRHTIRDIGIGVTNNMKKHPVLTLGTGLGLGFILGQFFKRRTNG